jgi:hypothetical protein
MAETKEYALYLEAADGSGREGPYPVDLGQLEPEELAEVERLEVGECYRYGGGAAPIFEIRRER